MNSRMIFVCLLLLASAISTPATAWEDPANEAVYTYGGPSVPFLGCTYYEDISFRGAHADISNGAKRNFLPGDAWYERISAIACHPYCVANVYDMRDNRGDQSAFRPNVSYVGDWWKAHLISMDVSCTIQAGMEMDTDRPGSDYLKDDYSSAVSYDKIDPDHFPTYWLGPSGCAHDCAADTKCRAWTYVRPGVQGKAAVCYRKDTVPAPVANNCCISGTVRDPIMSSVKETPGSMALQEASPDVKHSAVTETNASGGYAGDSNHSDFSKYAGTQRMTYSGPAVGEPGGFAGPAPTMTGTFDSDFGVLTLTKTDGTYSYKNGRVTITKIYGDFMDGTWSQSESGQRCPDGAYRGTFHFQFTKDGFKGTYGYCDGPTNAGPWNGTRR